MDAPTAIAATTAVVMASAVSYCAAMIRRAEVRGEDVPAAAAGALRRVAGPAALAVLATCVAAALATLLAALLALLVMLSFFLLMAAILTGESQALGPVEDMATALVLVVLLSTILLLVISILLVRSLTRTVRSHLRATRSSLRNVGP